MKKFNVGHYSSTDKRLIRSIEVVSESPAMLTLPDKHSRDGVRRISKAGNSFDGRFFDTWEEARQWLADRSRQSVNSLRRQLESAESHAAKVNALPLTEPEA